MPRKYAALFALLLAAPFVQAERFSLKDNENSSRYVETEADIKRRTFTEAEEALPPFPAEGTKWFELYVSPTFDKHLLISPDSIHAAEDGTVRYVLNLRSGKGIDNISSEALYCAPGSFSSQQGKKHSYKIYAYGDPVNKRWIKARNPQWQELGGAATGNAAVRAVLHDVWCVDGIPSGDGVLLERLNIRGGKYEADGRRSDRETKK